MICAGSSVGMRDQTAGAVAALPNSETWCHGLAIKPGKPTLLAHSDGIPIIGLPGNPRSALVVFRLIGMPIVRRAGGWTVQPLVGTIRATLARDLPSAAGRLDVVQVRLNDDARLAEPIFGSSALLSVLTAADGYVIVPEDANGLSAGEPVEVTRMASRTTPFLRDVPLATAQSAWRECCAAAGCPPRVDAVGLPDRAGDRPRHRRADLGGPLVAAVRLRGDGRDRRPRRGHRRRERDHAAAARPRMRSSCSTPATRCPTGSTRS